MNISSVEFFIRFGQVNDPFNKSDDPDNPAAHQS